MTDVELRYDLAKVSVTVIYRWHFSHLAKEWVSGHQDVFRQSVIDLYRLLYRSRVDGIFLFYQGIDRSITLWRKTSWWHDTHYLASWEKCHLLYACTTYRAWKMRSLRKLCHAGLPEQRLQNKPRKLQQSTSEPHTHIIIIILAYTIYNYYNSYYYYYYSYILIIWVIIILLLKLLSLLLFIG